MSRVRNINGRADRTPRSTLLLLTLFVSTIFLFFAFRTFLQLYTYLAYSSSAPAEIQDWHAQRLSADRYILEASYSYSAGDEIHHSDGRLKYHFLNELAALDAASRFDDLTVWFHPRHPDRSLLEKHFPAKSCFYLALVLGVLFYFSFLTLRYR
jgi:Protein of unknown function (DUF3592)